MSPVYSLVPILAALLTPVMPPGAVHDILKKSASVVNVNLSPRRHMLRVVDWEGELSFEAIVRKPSFNSRSARLRSPGSVAVAQPPSPSNMEAQPLAKEDEG